MPDRVPVTPRRKYSPLDVERGLTALAIYGNADEAARHTGIKRRTIISWRDKHPDRYQQITDTRVALIDQACIEEFRKIVLQGTKLTQEALALEKTRLNTGDVRDAAASARNIATTAAIATDKLALMTGNPTSIIEHRTPEQVIKALQAKGYVESTCEEDPTAEIPAPAAS